MVVRRENSREWIPGDKELIRFHEPLGWLSVRQYTNLTPEPDNLDETRTITGRGTERIYFGYSSTESMKYHLPPSMEDIPSNEGNRSKSLLLSVGDKSDTFSKKLINRFQNKEEFVPIHHPNIGDRLTRSSFGGFNWQYTEIVKAEIQVTAENASQIEASISIVKPDESSAHLPEVFLVT